MYWKFNIKMVTDSSTDSTESYQNICWFYLRNVEADSKTHIEMQGTYNR